MVKLPFKLAAIFSVIAFITLAATTVSAKNNLTSLACGCSYAIELDISLPLSHPKNRCAEGNGNTSNKDVSWFTWLSGKAKSHQFHYLDLLELLSRRTGQEYSKHS
jgi:hypothetical protein